MKVHDLIVDICHFLRSRNSYDPHFVSEETEAQGSERSHTGVFSEGEDARQHWLGLWAQPGRTAGRGKVGSSLLGSCHHKDLRPALWVNFGQHSAPGVRFQLSWVDPASLPSQTWSHMSSQSQALAQGCC